MKIGWELGRLSSSSACFHSELCDFGLLPCFMIPVSFSVLAVCSSIYFKNVVLVKDFVAVSLMGLEEQLLFIISFYLFLETPFLTAPKVFLTISFSSVVLIF